MTRMKCNILSVVRLLCYTVPIPDWQGGLPDCHSGQSKTGGKSEQCSALLTSR